MKGLKTFAARVGLGPLAIVAWSLCALLLCALPARAKEPIAVAVTIPPQAWLVEQIGGDRVEVTTLVAPGTSPETFQPADRDVSRVLRSAIYFRIGVPGERGPWFGALQRSDRVEIVDLRDGVELLALPRHHHHHDSAKAERQAEMDPHIWLSPKRLRQMAHKIAAALERLDGGSDPRFRSNLAAFEQRLIHLDAELEASLAPHADRAFMIFHPSWGYLADDYGLRQLAIELEGKEPTDAELTELMRTARREGLRSIFVQPQARSRSAETIARAIGGRVEVLDPLVADVEANLRQAAGRIAGSLGSL